MVNAAAILLNFGLKCILACYVLHYKRTSIATYYEQKFVTADMLRDFTHKVFKVLGLEIRPSEPNIGEFKE